MRYEIILSPEAIEDLHSLTAYWRARVKDAIETQMILNHKAAIEMLIEDADEVGFDAIKIAVKASNVPLMIESYRQLAAVTDHPLHLGVTEAGPLPGGLLKATAGIAALSAASRGSRRGA